MNTPLSLMGLPVLVEPALRPGTMYMLGFNLLVRHTSELLTAMRGACWHAERDGCPTWSDATECRCMVEKD